MLAKNERTGGNIKYLRIYQLSKKDTDGLIVPVNNASVWLKDDNGQDVRYTEDKDTKNIKVERGWWYDFVQGVVTEIKVDEKNKYGATLQITLTDGDDKYLLQSSLKSTFGQSLAERVPHIKIGDAAKFTPYYIPQKNDDGTPKLTKLGKQKFNIGVSVRINGSEQTLGNYFYDGQNNLHGSLPLPQDFFELPSAKREQFRLQQVIFLSEFINKHFANATADVDVSEIDLDSI